MPKMNLNRTVRMMGLVYKLQGTITEVLDADRVKVTWTAIVKDGEIVDLGTRATYQYRLCDLEFVA